MCGNSHPGWLPRPATPVLPRGSHAPGHLAHQEGMPWHQLQPEVQFLDKIHLFRFFLKTLSIACTLGRFLTTTWANVDIIH